MKFNVVIKFAIEPKSFAEAADHQSALRSLTTELEEKYSSVALEMKENRGPRKRSSQSAQPRLPGKFRHSLKALCAQEVYEDYED